MTAHHLSPGVPALLLLAALVPALAAGPLEAQEVELLWRFQTGEELRYEQVQTTSSGTPMGAVTGSQTTVIGKHVMGVAGDGAAHLRVTYESLRTVEDGPMGRQEYDSASGEAPGDPSTAVVAGLVGQSFEMTMGPRGEIRSVDGLDVLVDQLLDAAGTEGGPEVRAMMESIFGDEQMTSVMQQGVHVLPAGPVSVGAEWDNELVLSLPFGSVRSEYRYVLEEIISEGDGTTARIRVSGTVGELEPDPDNPMAGILSMSGGDLSGDIHFDVDRGVLMSASARTSMALSAMGQEMSIDTTQEMRLLDR
jgi:hypothetical protein